MHYLGLKALDLPVPMLNNPAVPPSILATIFASGITLLVVSGKSDSGRPGKAKSQRVSFDLAFFRTYAHSQMDITASRESLSRVYCWHRL
jgi:hypothetical protein